MAWPSKIAINFGGGVAAGGLCVPTFGGTGAHGRGYGAGGGGSSGGSGLIGGNAGPGAIIVRR